MVVSSTTFISDSELLIRNLLSNGITDPISAKRPTGQRFVMTSYPKRPEGTTYPIITVMSIGTPTDKPLGIGSQLQWVSMNFEIRIWARDMKQKANLTEQVINFLRSNQLSGQNISGSELHDFRVLSSVPIFENGENGIKSQVLQVAYKFVLGA